MKPIVTEKAVMMIEAQNTLTFETSKIKTKEEIKKEFEEVFKAKVQNIRTLIKAVQLLDQFSVTLIIAGSGKLEPKLKLLTQQLKLEDKVIFLGQLEPQHLIKYYSSADVFVRPSLSEGQGNSFIEAMAAGLPVIGTPVGGITDFLLDKKTGLFCQVKNPADLAQKIELLLSDKELYQEIQHNSLKLVSQKYDWQLIANQMKNLFSTLSS